MNTTLIGLIGFLACAAACSQGVSRTFRWVILPTLLLIPNEMVLTIAGLPDVNARAAAFMGLAAGALLSGQTHRLLPRWRWFDALALVPVISFSITYGLDTDFKGFYHRLAVLTLAWAIPYVVSRALLRDLTEVRFMLKPLVMSGVLLACLAVYECRMATRLASEFWTTCGFDVMVRRHGHNWRWGYLRAAVTYGHPIALGTVLATLTPLAVLWGLLEQRLRAIARGAVVVCAMGCVAALSRGPMLVLGAVAVVFVSVAVRGRSKLLAVLLIVMMGASPFLVDFGREELQFVQGEMDTQGNTTSGHYRVALLLIYGRQILDVGWWGGHGIDVSVGYEAAWSIDNGYLFLFLTGGWIGGGAFCLIVISLLVMGGRSIARTVGQDRKIVAAALASFAAVAGCMANVWFASDYVPFFWLTAALSVNVSASMTVGRAEWPQGRWVAEDRAAGALADVPAARPVACDG